MHCGFCDIYPSGFQGGISVWCAFNQSLEILQKCAMKLASGSESQKATHCSIQCTPRGFFSMHPVLRTVPVTCWIWRGVNDADIRTRCCPTSDEVYRQFPTAMVGIGRVDMWRKVVEPLGLPPTFESEPEANIDNDPLYGSDDGRLKLPTEPTTPPCCSPDRTLSQLEILILNPLLVHNYFTTMIPLAIPNPQT